MDQSQLLAEIRDLLKEQNRLIADIKAQNEAMAAKNLEHMAKAEAMGQTGLAQGASALSGTGWIKWGFWIFLILLLLMFALPSLWPLFAQERASIVVPPGFELQKLDTTEGRIAKPIGWFYRHSMGESSLNWVLAKEDPRAGAYRTGFRIQFVPAASKAGQLTPEQSVEQFIAHKQKGAEVKRLCPPVQIDRFVRRCLETIEGPQRILYTLFSSQALDMLVLTTFSAPAAEWEQARHIADRMNEFELLGADFWKKK